MTLQDIQKVSLDIMVEIDSFCRKNNLQYSLVGGAMIGAIRHKGFVPWDDDIDIAMHRPDFDRFCKLWENSSKYKLFSFSREGNLCETSNAIIYRGNGCLGGYTPI